MTKPDSRERFVPALGYDWLTGLYDPVVRLTTRERTFKRTLFEAGGFTRVCRSAQLSTTYGTLACYRAVKERAS